MAVAIRGGRGGTAVGPGLRSLFSYRIFVSAMFSLLFLATLSVILTSHPSTSHHDPVSPPPLHSFFHLSEMSFINYFYEIYYQ